MMFLKRTSLSLKPIAWDEPPDSPEGMVGSRHAGCLIQPIWFCGDSISEEESK